MKRKIKKKKKIKDLNFLKKVYLYNPYKNKGIKSESNGKRKETKKEAKKILYHLNENLKQDLKNQGYLKKIKKNNREIYKIQGKKKWINWEEKKIIKKYKENLKKYIEKYGKRYSIIKFWYLKNKKTKKKNAYYKKIKYIIKESCAKTLKQKYKITSKKKVYKKYGNIIKMKLNNSNKKT